jgi:hypothetical protein
MLFSPSLDQNVLLLALPAAETSTNHPVQDQSIPGPSHHNNSIVELPAAETSTKHPVQDQPFLVLATTIATLLNQLMRETQHDICKVYTAFSFPV